MRCRLLSYPPAVTPGGFCRHIVSDYRCLTQRAARTTRRTRHEKVDLVQDCLLHGGLRFGRRHNSAGLVLGLVERPLGAVTVPAGAAPGRFRKAQHGGFMWRAIRARVIFYAVVYIGGTTIFAVFAHYLGLWRVIFP